MPSGDFLIPSFLLHLLVSISVCGRDFSSLPSFSLFHPFYVNMDCWLFYLFCFIYLLSLILKLTLSHFWPVGIPARYYQCLFEMPNILWFFLLSDIMGYSMLILYFFSDPPIPPLEKKMATHSSILAWRIPWIEEPDGLQSMGSQRVGHDWLTLNPSITLRSPVLFFPIGK